LNFFLFSSELGSIEPIQLVNLAPTQTNSTHIQPWLVYSHSILFLGCVCVWVAQSVILTFGYIMIYAAAGAERSLLLLIPAAIFRGMAIIYFYVQTAAATTTGRRQLYHTHTHTHLNRDIFFLGKRRANAGKHATIFVWELGG